MPRRRSGRKRKRAAEGSGVDYIGALPDALIQHVLSFLPAHEAVRSCVLSRRWSDLWRSVPVLRITGANRWGTPVNFNSFVNRLLLLRGPSPLHEFEFETYTYMPLMLCNAYNDSEEPVRYVELWIAHAINCDVRVLRVLVRSRSKPLQLVKVPLTARHLTTLELHCVVLDNHALDFSRCPVLEDLKMKHCTVAAHKLSSQSLKRLRIASCDFKPYTFRTRISAPGLVLLQMRDNDGWTPVLESMPLLVTASVRPNGFDRSDNCIDSYCRGCHSGACLKCYGNRDGSDKSVVLRGLSNATNLELGAADEVRIFKQDMACCPTFSKLKTLVLDGWVVGCDFHVLLCFLQHAPILEKLTFLLYEANELMTNMEENCSPVEQLLPSDNLKIVEVICLKVDERVHNFLRILSTYGVSPDKISIQTTDSLFSKFSFGRALEDLASDRSTSSSDRSTSS